MSSATALKLTFPGSNPDVRIEPFDPLTTTVSYFIGSDPEQWRSDVPVYGGVRYVDLYPGVDLVIGGYSSAWRLKAAPGAMVEAVHIRIEGANLVAHTGAALELDSEGELLSIDLPSASFSYRASSIGNHGEWSGLTIGTGATTAAAAPDHLTDLNYSTFVGGLYDEGGAANAVDEMGDSFIAGGTYGVGFPSKAGAFDPRWNGNYDAFVLKLNSTGSAMVYGTFLGGDRDDRAGAIAVDDAGNAYVTGSTESSRFPTTPNTFDNSYNNRGDAFLVKLNPAGSGLAYATFLGGSDQDMGRGLVADVTGSVYVVGTTKSADFPTTVGAFDSSYNGHEDVLVSKLNVTGDTLIYSTFIGGRETDNGYDIAVDEFGRASIVGTTSSNDFPTTHMAFDTSHNGHFDAVIVTIDQEGGELNYGSFLGGSTSDQGYAIFVDDESNAYVTGSTQSGDFPVTPVGFDQSFNGGSDVFVAKLNLTSSNLVFATFLGGNSSDIGYAITVDAAGSAFITGGTWSENFPMTPGAFDTSHNRVVAE